MKSSIKIERILYATDLLENSRLALDYAVCFAQHFKATIVMLHVVTLSPAAREAELQLNGPSLARSASQQRLENLAEGVRRLGIPVDTHVVDGLVCATVIASVKTYRADLLVLGTHGVHRGLDHLLIGSNTEKILLSAECPTMTIGAHVLSGFDIEEHLKEIMYFSDFTPEATAAAPIALFLSKEFAAPVDPCLLLPPAAEKNESLRHQLAEDYCKSMKATIDNADAEWCTPAFQLDRGLELDQMIQRAKTQSAGLIVLGVHAESQFGRHVRTSFAYQVLSQASCPVVTVRPTPQANSGAHT
jgi:nucleotide-binding universal stress UspA family protein